MDRHPALRIAQLALGSVLILVAAVIAPLPGPGGIFPLAAGMVLILRNSRGAQRRFARMKRKRPRVGQVLDVAMRRRSALRRRALARQRAR